MCVFPSLSIHVELASNGCWDFLWSLPFFVSFVFIESHTRSGDVGKALQTYRRI